MRVMPAGFLMCCAAIHASACRCSSRPGASSCSAPIRRRATAAYRLHVGAVESIGGVVEVSQGQRRAALEVRNPGPQQQGNRIGPWHPLSGDAASSGAGHGQESAGAPVPGGHRQRAARSQVERLDPNDLDTRQIRPPQHRLDVRRAAATPLRRRRDRARSGRGPASRCNADGESLSATIARCSRPSRAPLRQGRLPPATRSCSGCTTPWRCTSSRCSARRPAAPEPAATPRRARPGTCRAQITRFCAMFNSHVTPTHWSRRIASACSANVEAFFHSPAVIAMMPSARIDKAIACGLPTLCRERLRLLERVSRSNALPVGDAPLAADSIAIARAIRYGSPASSAMSR